MAQSSRDQIKAALSDSDGLTESEIIDSMVGVSDGHALATLRNMANTGEVVAIVREAAGDLPAASLYRLPTSGELTPKKEELIVRNEEDDSPPPVPEFTLRERERLKNEVEKKIGRPKKSAIPVSPTLESKGLSLDRIALLVPVEQFRAYLYVNALAHLSESGRGDSNQLFQEELLSARAYLDRLIATYRV